MDEQSARQQFDRLCEQIGPAMQTHIEPFLTNISHAVENDYGRSQGSGSYIDYCDRRFLITNEHVTRGSGVNQYTYQFREKEDVFLLPKPLAAEPDPVDVAISEISTRAWSHGHHASVPIPFDRFAQKHAPVDRELLFFCGFSGERTKFGFGTLVAHGTPLLTQDMNPPVTGLHPNDFALNYNPEKARTYDGSRGTLPLPPGLSGSLVWNTRFVEVASSGQQWFPDLAQVTGMLCRWPENQPYIIGTRIEIIRDFLKRNLEGDP
jgi:hypothetical protein